MVLASQVCETTCSGLGTRYAVRTSNPMTGRCLPGAPLLNLSGWYRLPSNRIVDMGPRWSWDTGSRIGLRNPCSDAQRSSTHRPGECDPPHDFLHIHCHGPLLAFPKPHQISGTPLTCGLGRLMTCNTSKIPSGPERQTRPRATGSDRPAWCRVPQRLQSPVGRSTGRCSARLAQW